MGDSLFSQLREGLFVQSPAGGEPQTRDAMSDALRRLCLLISHSHATTTVSKQPIIEDMRTIILGVSRRGTMPRPSYKHNLMHELPNRHTTIHRLMQFAGAFGKKRLVLDKSGKC